MIFGYSIYEFRNLHKATLDETGLSTDVINNLRTEHRLREYKAQRNIYLTLFLFLVMYATQVTKSMRYKA